MTQTGQEGSPIIKVKGNNPEAIIGIHRGRIKRTREGQEVIENVGVLVDK